MFGFLRRWGISWTTDCFVSEFLLNIVVIKPTRCTNFSNLFWNKTLHVSDSSSVHHQEFFTAHTAMVYVIRVLMTARTLSAKQKR